VPLNDFSMFTFHWCISPLYTSLNVSFEHGPCLRRRAKGHARTIHTQVLADFVQASCKVKRGDDMKMKLHKRASVKISSNDTTLGATYLK